RRRDVLWRGASGAGFWMARGSKRGLRRLSLPRRRPRLPDPATDAELMERVRHTVAGVSPPEAIDVAIADRAVTLSGPILARDVVSLLRHVAKVPGVVAVHNRLRVQRLPRRTRN